MVAKSEARGPPRVGTRASGLICFNGWIIRHDVAGRAMSLRGGPLGCCSPGDVHLPCLGDGCRNKVCRAHFFGVLSGSTSSCERPAVPQGGAWAARTDRLRDAHVFGIKCHACSGWLCGMCLRQGEDDVVRHPAVYERCPGEFVGALRRRCREWLCHRYGCQTSVSGLCDACSDGFVCVGELCHFSVAARCAVFERDYKLWN